MDCCWVEQDSNGPSSLRETLLTYPYPTCRCPSTRFVRPDHWIDSESDRHLARTEHWTTGIVQGGHFWWTPRFGRSALIFRSTLEEQHDDISTRFNWISRFTSRRTLILPSWRLLHADLHHRWSSTDDMNFPIRSIWTVSNHCNSNTSSSSRRNPKSNIDRRRENQKRQAPKQRFSHTETVKMEYVRCKQRTGLEKPRKDRRYAYYNLGEKHSRSASTINNEMDIVFLSFVRELTTRVDLRVVAVVLFLPPFRPITNDPLTSEERDWPKRLTFPSERAVCQIWIIHYSPLLSRWPGVKLWRNRSRNPRLLSRNSKRKTMIGTQTSTMR